MMGWAFGLGLAAAYGAGLLALLARFGPWTGLFEQWGEAALAVGGDAPFAHVITRFPPLPYLLSALLEGPARLLAGRVTLPGPILASAILPGRWALPGWRGFAVPGWAARPPRAPRCCWRSPP